MATGIDDAPVWGSFALVAYLPDPLGSFLTKLRRALSGDQHPQAHITFLPPRPLSVPLETTAAEIHRILRSVTAFELELGAVQVFPVTNMLYLEVKSGREAVVGLHKSLNSGGLFAEENFAYIPHLTLLGPLAAEAVPALLGMAETAWNQSGLARRFTVQEITLLWQSGEQTQGNWSRQSSFALDHPAGHVPLG